jgi:hypothetical protein
LAIRRDALPVGGGMQGNIKVGRLPEAGVEMGFGDILKSLSFGFMGALEGHKERWGFLFDMILHEGLPERADARQHLR